MFRFIAHCDSSAQHRNPMAYLAGSSKRMFARASFNPTDFPELVADVSVHYWSRASSHSQQLPILPMTAGDKLSVLVGDFPRRDGLIKVVRDDDVTGYVPVNYLQAINPSDDFAFVKSPLLFLH
jgi:hypothetical protein